MWLTGPGENYELWHTPSYMSETAWKKLVKVVLKQSINDAAITSVFRKSWSLISFCSILASFMDTMNPVACAQDFNFVCMLCSCLLHYNAFFICLSPIIGIQGYFQICTRKAVTLFYFVSQTFINLYKLSIKLGLLIITSKISFVCCCSMFACLDTFSVYQDFQWCTLCMTVTNTPGIGSTFTLWTFLLCERLTS